MKILVLGGDGMLGHKLLTSWTPRHDVVVTLRQPLDAYRQHGLFTRENAIGGLDADDPRLLDVIRERRPDAVVNAIGVVKQRKDAKAAIPSISINSLLPHRLCEVSESVNARFVHMSTDCVFSGRTGSYRETDVPDAVDLYGRSKLLGEVHDAPGITLRTSIIGLELSRFTSLVEWFLGQRGMIRGFTRAIYTGLTTAEMARIIERVLERHPRLHGIWHVASAPINKHDLLVALAKKLDRRDIDIVADDGFVCDRSLMADAFQAETGYVPPSWDAMLDELAGEIRARDTRAGSRIG